MKLDSPKSYDKVFEDDGETVTVSAEVEDTLMRYKSGFETNGWRWTDYDE